MKIAKVKIKKIRNETSTKFVYPLEYDAKEISPFLYQNENLDEEYCLANVPDHFIFSDDIIEVSETEAKKLVDSFVDKDKDLGELDKEQKDEIKQKRKNHII